MILIQHPSIERDAVWSIFERRWPDVMVTEIGDAEPSYRMSVDDAVDLARRRRGVEPLRIIILPMAMAMPSDDRAEPMPMIL